MHLIVTILHVLVCFALIIIVLVQKGKGADMGAAFGGSSQAVFGGAGASSFLSKVTTAAAVVFMVTSLLLTVMGKSGHKSIMDGAKVPAAQQQSAPASQQQSAPAGTGQAKK